MQGAQDQSLVRALEPTCCNRRFHVPQLKPAAEQIHFFKEIIQEHSEGEHAWRTAVRASSSVGIFLHAESVVIGWASLKVQMIPSFYREGDSACSLLARPLAERSLTSSWTVCRLSASVFSPRAYALLFTWTIPWGGVSRPKLENSVPSTHPPFHLKQ